MTRRGKGYAVADAIEGGYDTTRVSMAGSAEEESARVRRRAKARANLEAFALEQHPDDEVAARAWFVETCQILGLDEAESEYPPGMCRSCGSEMSMTRATPNAKGNRLLCPACDRARAVKPPPSPGPVAPPAPVEPRRWDLNAAELALLRDVYAGRVYRAEGHDWRRAGGTHRQIGRAVHYLPPGLVQLGADGRLYELTRHGEAQVGEVAA